MIYTIGYQATKPPVFDWIVKGLNGLVVDCRSKPRTRIAGYGSKQIPDRVGADHYVWKGDVLGGMKPGVLPEGIAWIKAQAKAFPDRPLILMCMEHSPDECHRHHAIVMPFFKTKALHIYEGGLFEPVDWQKVWKSPAGQETTLYPIRQVWDDFTVKVASPKSMDF